MGYLQGRFDFDDGRLISAARQTATRVRGVIARRCGAGALRRDGGRWRRGGSAPPKKGQLKDRPAAGRRGRKSIPRLMACRRSGRESRNHTRGLAPRARWRYLFPKKGDEARKPWPNGQRNVLSAAAARQGNEINKAMTPNRFLTCGNVAF
jgi:hypothetical protein